MQDDVEEWKLPLMSPQHIPQPLHHGKESIIPNLPPNQTTTGHTRSQNLKINPDQTQTGPI